MSYTAVPLGDNAYLCRRLSLPAWVAAEIIVGCEQCETAILFIMLTNKVEKPFRWKRFTRASYAVFMSLTLRRNFTIGVLSAAMLSTVSLKTKAFHATGDAGIRPSELSADPDPGDSMIVSLEDIEVLSSRVPLTQVQASRMVTVLSAAEISAAAVQSINDLLEYAVGVDVRQRGEMGVQTDISVRGGTCDQITLLLNGINISAPNTGHHSADFPVSVQDIERIEVLEGSAARVFGTSAFSGAINIVTRQESDAVSVHLAGGEYGYAGGDIRIGKSYTAKESVGDASRFTHHLSGGYSRADGATPNSGYESTRAFYQAAYSSSAVKADLQLGYSYKPFEANTFYGSASTDQWESNERYMAALRAETLSGRFHFAPAIYWNRWFDHYQWHKDSPVGENYHQVDVYGAMLNSWVDSRWGKTSLGIEMRNEGIYSTKLGKPLPESEWRRTAGHDGHGSVYYGFHDNRTNISAFGEHNVLLEHWTFSFGVLANLNTGLDSRWRFYPGVDISWRPSPDWKLFASWNMALRMPTFTDLYYSGTGIEGNDHLHPEKTTDVCIGSRYRRRGWKAEASVFYSHKSNMIDWVVYAGDSTNTYRSGNFKLDNAGFEISAAWLPWEATDNENCVLRRLGIAYAYMNSDICYEADVVRSKYAMEYLWHKVVVQAEARLFRRLDATVSWRWQDRVGEGNKAYALLDARLSWNAPSWSLYADCTNLLDKTYFDYDIVPQPGRWLKVGFVRRFEL